MKVEGLNEKSAREAMYEMNGIFDKKPTRIPNHIETSKGHRKRLVLFRKDINTELNISSDKENS